MIILKKIYAFSHESLYENTKKPNITKIAKFELIDKKKD
jgi:hypothetical protein